MQVSQGGTSLSSELFSADGVIRGSDLMTYNGDVFFGGALVTAGAAERARVQLYNPAVNNVVIFIDRIDFFTEGNDTVALNLQALLGETGINFWQSEKSDGNSGTGQLYSSVVPAIESGYGGLYRGVSGEMQTIVPPFPFVIMPGDLISLQNWTLDMYIQATFYGREFAL